ncbi:hypothetical protein EDF46_3088 [Frondihabitans sp. PhB188]|uniref:hypothetical protein n=1 Tax=Frondihabitans sp. PhB188 TaxID=2485200 RepID=UPI000F4852B0|nr:hypothetical protein [Frondihabitans sp. PhB188]ROQ36546.1 hypothetical protein EDF46_3088 [Frondihabitans sp. PhB188]
MSDSAATDSDLPTDATDPKPGIETAPDRRDSDDPTVDSPRSEAVTRDLQDSDVEESAAVDDDIDTDDIVALPGTGGPDDGGDIEVDESELNLSGDSIPGHPKPSAGR